MKSIKIRKALKKDIPKILRLWKEMMDYHSDLKGWGFELSKDARSKMQKHISNNLTKKDSIVLIAEDKSVSVGYCLVRIDYFSPVYKNGKYALVNDGYVKKEYRKKGIMGEMIKKIEEFYKERRITDLSLSRA